jgi:glycosyltransferase involved in cell wall biosynthesis
MLKRYLERAGHICLVLNTNKNRRKESTEFVAIHNGLDYLWKIFKYSAQGFLVHVHINGKSTKSPILASVAEAISLLFRRPAVLTFHAGPVQDYFPRQGKPVIDWGFRLIFMMAGKIICNNQAVKDRIVEYGIRSEKIIPIPAFCPQYLEDKAELPAEIAGFIQRHQPVVCSYIYLRPDFNVSFLLQGMQKLAQEYPRLGLIFMGAYKEVEPLQRLLREHRLAGNSLVASDLDHGVFLAVLAASRIYVRTPVVDGVSSSVLEALALGTMVVASENGSRPAGVVTYRDGEVADFVQKIRSVLDGNAPVNGAASVRVTEMRDTLQEEIAVLVNG